MTESWRVDTALRLFSEAAPLSLQKQTAAAAFSTGNSGTKAFAGPGAEHQVPEACGFARIQIGAPDTQLQFIVPSDQVCNNCLSFSLVHLAFAVTTDLKLGCGRNCCPASLEASTVAPVSTFSSGMWYYFWPIVPEHENISKGNFLSISIITPYMPEVREPTWVSINFSAPLH